MGKGWKMTEEQRQRNIEAQKKAWANPELRKRHSLVHMGQVAWNKGKTGAYSPEQLKRMSESHIGHVPWNKGKTWGKGISPSKETIEKLRLSHLGQKSWNKGKIGVYSEESRKKMSESHKRLELSNDNDTRFKKGHKFSEEILRKIREATKRAMANPEVLRKLSESHKGHVPWNKGKIGIYNAEQLKRMSEALKGKPAWNKGITGEKSTSWRGGLSFEPYSPEWTEVLKNLIKERDNHICQMCSKKGNIVHHIDYNKKNSSPENLITLCNTCHGKTNHYREKWKKFFLEKKK